METSEQPFTTRTRAHFSVHLVFMPIISAATPHASAQVSLLPALAPEHVAAAQALYARFLKSRTCETPRLNYPKWEGFPVQLCHYEEQSKIDPKQIVTAKTYMLLPSSDMLARWTVTACADVGSTDTKKCIETLVSTAKIASSGNIFPVAGYIPESRSSAGGAGHEILCLPFRDGVTAYSKKYSEAPLPANNVCVTGDLNDQPIVKARTYARVVSTTRLDYKRNGGTEGVGTDYDRDPRWIDVVRTLFQRAWTSDRNELMSAKAKALRDAGVFK
jgi:hypothetical protein